MRKTKYLFSGRTGIVALALCLLPTGFMYASASSLIEPSTAIPIRFVHSVDAGKAHPGDQVLARTIQVVVLPSGQRLPKGTVVRGHIVQVRPHRRGTEEAPEAQPSLLSIHFDQIEYAAEKLPVNLAVRALADSMESYDAATPYHLDETDGLGTMVLIGGGTFSPLDKIIRNEDSTIIGHNRKDGVFAPLIAVRDIAFIDSQTCSSTEAEQAVAIFSPAACGLYGFSDVSMPDAGRNGSGSFTLMSNERSVKLYAGTTALVQQTQAH